MTDREFEVRLASILRADAERAVRPIDAVSLAVGAVQTAQPARRALPLRSVLLVALLATGLIAGLVAMAGALRNARPMVTENAPIGLDSNGSMLGASTWAADIESIDGLEVAGRAHLVAGYGGATASLRGADGRLHLASRISSPAGEAILRFELIRDGSGCRAGDVGEYRATPTSDQERVRLEFVVDPCTVRRSALERTWHRTLRLHSEGGLGLVDVFEPVLRIRLAAGEWSLSAFEDGFTMGEYHSEVGFEVVKNPQGITDPCAVDGGDLISIAPGADAFIAYVEGLPGVTVATSDSTIGGYPARRLVATWDRPASCSPILGMAAWRINTPDLHRMGGGLAGEDVIYVIDRPGATIVITAGLDGEVVQSLDLLPGLPAATGPP